MLVVADIIGYLLAIPGFISVAYLLWIRFNKDLRLYSISAYYNAENTNEEEVKEINISVKMSLLNNSEQSVVLTDVIGILKYNKELYKDKLSKRRDIPTIPRNYEQRPTNLNEITSFIVTPHESKTHEFHFTFPPMILQMVERMPPAYFMGFFNKGKTAVWSVHESDIYENWSNHPLQMLFIIHVDAKQIVHEYIPVLLQGSTIYPTGTIYESTIAKIKNEDYEKNSISVKKNI